MIKSDVIWITTETTTSEEIENQLTQKYGSLIRWAIVAVAENKLKICLTYEKTGS